jgi:hypothetical protein
MQRVYTIGIAVDAKDVPKSAHAEELRARVIFRTRALTCGSQVRPDALRSSYAWVPQTEDGKGSDPPCFSNKYDGSQRSHGPPDSTSAQDKPVVYVHGLFQVRKCNW